MQVSGTWQLCTDADEADSKELPEMTSEARARNWTFFFGRLKEHFNK